MVLLAMFSAAGGYKHNHKYFDAFEAHWQNHSPEQLLLAARVSLYPPKLDDIKSWCRSDYPELAYFLWTPRTNGRYSCCPNALDTLD